MATTVIKEIATNLTAYKVPVRDGVARAGCRDRDTDDRSVDVIDVLSVLFGVLLGA